MDAFELQFLGTGNAMAVDLGPRQREELVVAKIGCQFLRLDTSHGTVTVCLIGFRPGRIALEMQAVKFSR